MILTNTQYCLLAFATGSNTQDFMNEDSRPHHLHVCIRNECTI
ncbi:hypothetical protein [Vibrio gallaecicus]|nr:hypothetical protein [Vibrio gallaecicus]MDN3613062.1 hypothetical protein [Vibrio gallaecicus]